MKIPAALLACIALMAGCATTGQAPPPRKPGPLPGWTPHPVHPVHLGVH